jgi:hypothetical protein
MQIYNSAVYYRVGVRGPAQRGVDYEPDEHFSVPAMLNFRDPTNEGFPTGTLYAAIAMRAATTATPIPQVTIA